VPRRDVDAAAHVGDAVTLEQRGVGGGVVEQRCCRYTTPRVAAVLQVWGDVLRADPRLRRRRTSWLAAAAVALMRRATPADKASPRCGDATARGVAARVRGSTCERSLRCNVIEGTASDCMHCRGWGSLCERFAGCRLSWVGLVF
jgi:hypothetical protein